MFLNSIKFIYSVTISTLFFSLYLSISSDCNICIYQFRKYTHVYKLLGTCSHSLSKKKFNMMNPLMVQKTQPWHFNLDAADTNPRRITNLCTYRDDIRLWVCATYVLKSTAICLICFVGYVWTTSFLPPHKHLHPCMHGHMTVPRFICLSRSWFVMTTLTR